MVELPVDLEFYPSVSEELKDFARKEITTNAAHWEAPFFMDVYAYANIEDFKAVCKPYLEDPKIKNIIILGTGGSYQTMKALSLFSEKNLVFLTSSRPHELAKVLSETKPDDSVVLPISRAGKTLDVNSILGSFKEYKMIALSSQGPMFDLVKKLNATIVDVPDLSGRFAASVCSVGLLPAILAKIDVEEFQKGLADAYTLFKDLKNSSNIALEYAVFLDKIYKKGFRNIFSMPYSEWLEGAAGLFVQEISESSGKEGNGLLGTMQPAPLCQHSCLELLLGGSKGHTSPLLWTTYEEPVDVELMPIEAVLEGQTGLSVINYQLDATFQALIEQGIPTAKLAVKEISPYSMGVVVAFIQTTVYYYCLITDVNWSSNPLVNTGKKICNDALARKVSRADLSAARKEIANKKFEHF
jgi:glucose-6-phosphate isomerase